MPVENAAADSSNPGCVTIISATRSRPSKFSNASTLAAQPSHMRCTDPAPWLSATAKLVDERIPEAESLKLPGRHPTISRAPKPSLQHFALTSTQCATESDSAKRAAYDAWVALARSPARPTPPGTSCDDRRVPHNVRSESRPAGARRPLPAPCDTLVIPVVGRGYSGDRRFRRGSTRMCDARRAWRPPRTRCDQTRERDHPCNHAHSQRDLSFRCDSDGDVHSPFEAQAMPIPISRSGVCDLAMGRWATQPAGGGSMLASVAQAGFSGVSWSSRIDRVRSSRAGGRVRPVAHCCQSPSALSRSCSQRARPA